MIGSLSGRLVEVHEHIVLLDVGGVGYEVEMTTGALSLAVSQAAEFLLYTHLVTREDAQLLYGFASRDERDLFRSLIRVNGVGPKMALNLLSGLDLAELARAVANQQVSAFTKIPGIGKKTAERLLVELKGRLDNLTAGHATRLPGAAVTVSISQPQNEAMDALLNLGYRASEVSKVLDNVIAAAPDASTEELVRQSLQQIYRQAEVGR